MEEGSERDIWKKIEFDLKLIEEKGIPWHNYLEEKEDPYEIFFKFLYFGTSKIHL